MLDHVYQNCLKFEKSCDTFLSQREFPFTSKWIFTNRTLYPITENIHANEQSHQGQAKEQAMVVGRVLTLSTEEVLSRGWHSKLDSVLQLNPAG